MSPFGELLAVPDRGLVYGNRGCLHDATGAIRRHHNGRRWIACRLRFRGWHRHPLLQPGRFTELFFLDEATAFAAGHRPCALCRREDYLRFGEIWARLHGERGADAIDVRLHSERWDGQRQRHRTAPLDRLPDGALIVRDDEAWLVCGEVLLRWTPAGYVQRAARPKRHQATVITPLSLLAVLGSGWRSAVPLFHASANESCHRAWQPTRSASGRQPSTRGRESFS